MNLSPLSHPPSASFTQHIQLFIPKTVRKRFLARHNCKQLPLVGCVPSYQLHDNNSQRPTAVVSCQSSAAITTAPEVLLSCSSSPTLPTRIGPLSLRKSRSEGPDQPARATVPREKETKTRKVPPVYPRTSSLFLAHHLRTKI